MTKTPLFLGNKLQNTLSHTILKQLFTCCSCILWQVARDSYCITFFSHTHNKKKHTKTQTTCTHLSIFTPLQIFNNVLNCVCLLTIAYHIFNWLDSGVCVFCVFKGIKWVLTGKQLDPDSKGSLNSGQDH